MSAQDLRIGTVPFINARPLWSFLSEVDSSAQLIKALPSELAVMLKARNLDAGVISSFLYLIENSLSYVPGICIASNGSVSSVNLFHLKDLGSLSRVAVDRGSLSSVALMQIILAELYDVQPELIPADPNLEEMLKIADAALLIGDEGMKASLAGTYPALDLGEAWKKLTGLPFVYALWLCPDQQTARRVEPILQEAKQKGLSHLPDIARESASETGLPKEFCLSYLGKQINYELGEAELSGLEEFRRRCHQLGLAPDTAAPKARILG